jgi:hypothetical protein
MSPQLFHISFCVFAADTLLNFLSHKGLLFVRRPSSIVGSLRNPQAARTAWRVLPPARIVQYRRDRDSPIAAHVVKRISADSITGTASRSRDLMSLRRDQKLLPHFGEASAAVFAVEKVEYRGHDPSNLVVRVDLHHHFQAIIWLGVQDVKKITACPTAAFRH